MASAYIEDRKGPRGTRYRAVLEWRVAGKPKKFKAPWTRYWKRAQAKKLQLLAEAEDVKLGLKAAAPLRTWGALAAEYERYSLADKEAATWQNWDKPALRHFGAYLDKHGRGPLTPLPAITTEMVLGFRHYLEDAAGPGLAPNTVAGYGRHLTACFNYAIKPLRWLSTNPCADVPWPKYVPTGQVIPDDLLDVILAHARRRLRPLAWLDRHSGARSGELVNLDHRQLDHAARCVRIYRRPRRGRASAWRPKTERSSRLIPILPEHWTLFGPARDEGPVFDAYTGTPKEKVNAVARDFRDAVKALLAATPAGTERADLRERVAGISFHDIKHTFCTDFLVRRGTTAKLAELTGTSEATLKKVYAHLLGTVTHEDLLVRRGPMPNFFPPRFHPKSPDAVPDDSGKVIAIMDKRRGSSMAEQSLRKRISAFPSSTKMAADGCCPTCGQSLPVSFKGHGYPILETYSTPGSTPNSAYARPHASATSWDAIPNQDPKSMPPRPHQQTTSLTTGTRSSR